MGGNDLTVTFPDFAYPSSSSGSLQCAEDGSLKVSCDYINWYSLPPDTFPCCHVRVWIGSESRPCTYSNGHDYCEVFLTLNECNQVTTIEAEAHTAVLPTGYLETYVLNGER